MAENSHYGVLSDDLRKTIYSLYEISLACTTDKPSMDTEQAAFVMNRLGEFVGYMGDLENLCKVLEAQIPVQVIQDIDAVQNPFLLTKERIERAASENQHIGGKLEAITKYREILASALNARA